MPRPAARPSSSRTTTPRTAPKRATPPTASRASASRPRTRNSSTLQPKTGGGEAWMHRLDGRRVAFIVALVMIGLCLALLLDVYLGQSDSVHIVMIAAFGPLAFLVPVGAGLIVLDGYRRLEGQRAWLRFEESCGVILLFIATLTLASLSGLSDSLIGNSLSDELVSVIGRLSALLVVLVLIAVGVVLALHLTATQARSVWRVVRQLVTEGARGVMQVSARLGRGQRAASATAPGSATVPVPLPASALSAGHLPRRRPEGRLSQAAEGRENEPTVIMPVLPEVLVRELSAPRAVVEVDETEAVAELPPDPTAPAWPAPRIDLLDAVPPEIARPTDNDQRARTIEQTLASFNVTAEVVEVQSGPTVTQFGLRPAPGVRVQRITALANDLALALAAPSIRIEAPVPGKPVVGIEIPNATTALVTLRELLESDAYTRMKSPLKVALGQNVSGDPVVVDLARMPHLLIAGATGSGKSVCLNSLIACLLFSNSPDRLRLLMIDPKMVELTTFNGVPHLLHPVVTEMDKVSGTLKWVLKEMHRRYKLFGEAGVRNIARYNERQLERLQAGEQPIEKNKPLPYIVFIIDELADLMMVSPAEVEDSISRLAALARATGIHLVLATQRPSVDVITGVIKANFPARIAFAVSSQVDSRTILDGAGAEKLLGRGDMLYLPSDGSKMMRVQGTFLSDGEIERLVAFWSTAAPEAPPRISEAELEPVKSEDGDGEDGDKLLAEATRVVREYRRASVSLLQRRLSVGYSRAARLLDQLEERGVVGPSEDGRSRVVIEALAEVPVAPLLVADEGEHDD